MLRKLKCHIVDNSNRVIYIMHKNCNDCKVRMNMKEIELWELILGWTLVLHQ